MIRVNTARKTFPSHQTPIRNAKFQGFFAQWERGFSALKVIFFEQAKRNEVTSARLWRRICKYICHLPSCSNLQSGAFWSWTRRYITGPRGFQWRSKQEATVESCPVLQKKSGRGNKEVVLTFSRTGRNKENHLRVVYGELSLTRLYGDEDLLVFIP